MQSSSSATFADIIASLVVLHREQQQALLELRGDQERCFQAILQTQQEDREAFRSWIDQEVPRGPTEQPTVPVHLPLNKMGPLDDPEVFLDLFERSVEACKWPRDQWSMRLVLLLSGEAQVAAQQLPIPNLLVYEDLRQAIVQRVGRTPEQHRQRFRSLDQGESGRPFTLAQQLRDSCRKWLLAEGSDMDLVVDCVVLEQFIIRLPKKTAEWVQCHRPTSLDSAIQLAEDHLVACQGGGEPLPAASLSPSLLSPSLSRPVPLPRSRPPCPPRVPPRGPSGALDTGRMVGVRCVHGDVTDASDRGLGAVLSQEIEGEEWPVLYISRKLSKREAKYSTIEKECLAIRWAVLTLRYYLLGREFTLCSDHAPLQWLHRMKDTNARITR
ncbi:uncharacterized protein [Chanodichthys erythropterus]|uniref:uncharacterized protein n=1 Tax=Chanodichthys erythropterus TaxID=933992 RepID=UPI00351E8D19